MMWQKPIKRKSRKQKEVVSQTSRIQEKISEGTQKTLVRQVKKAEEDHHRQKIFEYNQRMARRSIKMDLGRAEARERGDD